LKIATQANHLVTALNTYFVILPYYMEEYNEFALLSYQTRYVEEEESNAPTSVFSYCEIDNPTSTLGFGWTSLFKDFYSHIEWYSYRREWYNDDIKLKQIDGFFSGCSPLANKYSFNVHWIVYTTSNVLN
jgi:hypothetical protein